MRSWFPTRSTTDVALDLTIDRHQLATLLTPAAAISDTAKLQIAGDALAVRAVDTARVRSVTAVLEANACSQYEASPGQLAVDPRALRDVLTTDAAASTNADAVSLTYAADDTSLDVTLPMITHAEPVDSTPDIDIPWVDDWPAGATLHHQAGELADVWEYFVEITDAVVVGYDATHDVFRIEDVIDQPADGDDLSEPTGTYERTRSELPGETVPRTVQATFDSALVRDILAAAPADTRVQLDIADAHPLQLRWTVSPSHNDGPPVEVTALIAPRDSESPNTDTE